MSQRPKRLLSNFDVVARQNTFNGLFNPSDVQDNRETRIFFRVRRLSVTKAGNSF